MPKCDFFSGLPRDRRKAGEVVVLLTLSSDSTDALVEAGYLPAWDAGGRRRLGRGDSLPRGGAS